MRYTAAGDVDGRFERKLQSGLLAEAGVGFFRPDEQSGRHEWYTIPEGQRQIQFPWDIVRPYLGGGLEWVVRNGRESTGTASIATGLRVSIPASQIRCARWAAGRAHRQLVQRLNSRVDTRPRVPILIV